MNRKVFLVIVAVLVVGIGVTVGVGLYRGGGEPAGRSAGPETWDAATRQHVQQQHALIEEHLQRADFAAAQQLAAALAGKYPGDAEAFALQAKALVGLSRVEPAYDAAMKAVQLDPKMHEIQFMAGILAEQLGRPVAAAARYEAAMQAQDSVPKYPLYLSNLLLKQNADDQAQLYALRVLRLDPTVPQAYAILAEIAARQDKLDMAVEQMNRAIKLSAADSDARYSYTIQRARFLRRKGPAGRDEALTSLLALPEVYRQNDRTLTRELAVTYLSLERPSDAAEAWSTWFAQHPGDAAAAAEAGLAWHRAGDAEQARRALEAARRLKPHEPTVQALADALSTP